MIKAEQNPKCIKSLNQDKVVVRQVETRINRGFKKRSM